MGECSLEILGTKENELKEIKKIYFALIEVITQFTKGVRVCRAENGHARNVRKVKLVKDMGYIRQQPTGL